MKKYVLAVFFIMCFCVFSYTQVPIPSSTTSPEIIPSSPTSSSLGKYGAFSNNLYTGATSVSIPLYEINAGEINIPIALNYHASGIRVDDIASSVGLGWSLNAGGCISVETKGRPDILPFGYSNSYTRIHSLTFKEFLDTEANFKNYISVQNIKELVTNGEILDSEPDIYNFNFGNYSGQFFIKENKTIQFLKNNNGIRALFNANDASFQLIDKEGVTYIFKHKEITSSSTFDWVLENKLFWFGGINSVIGSKKYYSAWNLSQIIGQNKLDTINFIYEINSEEYTSRITGSLNNSTSSVPGNNRWDTFQIKSFTNSSIKHTVFRLKEIVHNNSRKKIVLNYSGREDLSGGKKIDKIILLYDNRVVSQYIFNYSYFITEWEKDEKRPDKPTLVLNPLHKRLKLCSIQKYGDSINIKENPYAFTYYYDTPNSKLAHRNCTNGFDHWGYFNMELNNEEEVNNVLRSFPKADASMNIPITNQIGLCYNVDGVLGGQPPLMRSVYLNPGIPSFPEGGNREPTIYAKALSLKSITYPTGGKTAFDYENNSYNSVGNCAQVGIFGGIRISKITERTGNDSIIKKYIYDGGVIHATPNYVYLNYSPGGPFACSAHVIGHKLNNFSDVSAYAYGEMIGYKKVTEKTVNTKNNEEHKTIYSYYTASNSESKCYEKAGIIFVNNMVNYFEDSIKTVDLFQNLSPSRTTLRPFDALILGKSFKHGLIRSIQHIATNNDVMHEEFYFYDFITTDSIFGNCFRPHFVDIPPTSNYPTSAFIDIYYHETGKSFLKKKVEKSYDSNGQNPVTKVTEYEYNTSTEQIKSEKYDLGYKTIRIVNNYPNDYNFLYYQGNPHPLTRMKERNMINYPIVQKTFLNDKVISSKLTTYLWADENKKILKPSSIYKLENKEAIVDFIALSSGDANTAYTFSHLMTKEYDYTYYDNGKVKDLYDSRTNIHTVYIWGYKGQYPIAEIINASYSEVQTALGINPEELSNSANPNMSLVNSLRGKLPHAQVSTYTYKPLVGMTSKTDPRGVTTYYEYDGFGRLKQAYIIENGVEKNIETYDYHYKQ